MSEFKDELAKKAVALSYDGDEKSAPVVVASGMGHMAEKIVETAMENGVPIYEDNSLATVLTQLRLGSEIPTELYQAIVEIYLYFLNYAPGHERIDNSSEEKTVAETASVNNKLKGEPEDDNI